MRAFVVFNQLLTSNIPKAYHSDIDRDCREVAAIVAQRDLKSRTSDAHISGIRIPRQAGNVSQDMDHKVLTCYRKVLTVAAKIESVYSATICLADRFARWCSKAHYLDGLIAACSCEVVSIGTKGHVVDLIAVIKGHHGSARRSVEHSHAISVYVGRVGRGDGHVPGVGT